MTGILDYQLDGDIAVITLDNPPVNAMGRALRQAVIDAMQRLDADATARAAVIICAGRTFIAGADISEFNQPKADPDLGAVVQRIEQARKPVIAAIHGTALGGGLETAMGCHYRVALASARVGMPEVKLGLLPGASGTQRLPRLAGVEHALDLMISGDMIPAVKARDLGIIDEIVDGELRVSALAFARRVLAERRPLRRISRLPVDAAGIDATFFERYRARIAPRTRGYFSPEQIVRCVEASVSLPYRRGLTVERRLFEKCRKSVQSGAQRHLFFAEREVARIRDVPRDTPVREIRKVGIVGAGTMGGGITTCFLNAGLPVCLVESDRAALDRGMERIRAEYEGAVAKGRMTPARRDESLKRLHATMDLGELRDADLVVEAVFEDMPVKKQLFRRLDGICKVGAILATNTSTLDVNEIATATGRASDVIGLHFFAPANIMSLLEVVRGSGTGRDVIATAMSLARKIGKTAVLVGVCFGFAGNRIFTPYVREAQRMILEGIPPERIDQVAFEWGMAMGPNAVLDLSGLDVFQRMWDQWDGKPDDPAFCRMITVLHGRGRLGRKSGAGFYRYDGRTPVPDPEVMAMARHEARSLGIRARRITDREIIQRLVYALINEGARVLEEGIAQRSGDIDVIFANGYGFPRYRGGPMFYADTVGLAKIVDAIGRFRRRYGDADWQPASLLAQLAAAGGDFSGWQAQG